MVAFLILVTLFLADGKTSNFGKSDTTIVKKLFAPVEGNIMLIPDTQNIILENDAVIRETSVLHLQTTPPATQLQIVGDNNSLINSQPKNISVKTKVPLQTNIVTD